MWVSLVGTAIIRVVGSTSVDLLGRSVKVSCCLMIILGLFIVVTIVATVFSKIV